MSDLPEGWAWSTVADVLANGFFADGDWVETKDQDPDGEIRLLQLADVGDGFFRDRSSRFVNVEAAERLTVKPVEPGDVLVARMPAPLGRACIAPDLGQPAITVVDVCILRPDAGIDRRWLMWALNSPVTRAEVAGLATGTTRKRISRRNLATIRLPVPPLPEQRRIVAAIEEHFSRLDAAEACLGSAAKRAARLPDAACSALTNDGSWRVVELTDLLTSLRNGAFVSRPSADPPGMPILRISAVRQRRLDQTDVRYATPAPAGADRYQVDPGDLLFTRYSGNPKYVGACAVVPPDAAGLLHPDKLIRGVVDEAQADPRWISSYVSVGAGRASIESRLKTTAGQVGISGRQLKSVEIAVPPIEEQIRRCNEIDRFSDLADSVGAAIDVAARRSSGLRRAVLAAAFSGQLVPQDPADEPASVLLERIAAERAAAKPPRRKRVTA